MVNRAAVTERPQGFVALVDDPPCGAGPRPHPDKTTYEEALALPLPKQQGAKTPPDVRVEVVECTYLRGWLNFFGTGCTDAVVRTLHNLDAHIRRRLRALLLRQWKRKRFLVRRLIRMGARASTAWRVVYEGHKSLWALSHCSPVDHALNNAYFAKRGLFSLEHQYRDMHRVVA